LGSEPEDQQDGSHIAQDQQEYEGTGRETHVPRISFRGDDGDAPMYQGNSESQNTRGDKMAPDDLGENETALLNRVLDLTKWTILALLVIGGFLGPSVLGVV